MGDTGYYFESFFFIFWIPIFQISKPGLGQAWAGPGLDTARVDLVGPELDWTGPGPGLCPLDVLSMFPPLMKKPPIFSVPWFLEASFVFFCWHQVSKPLSCIFQSRC